MKRSTYTIFSLTYRPKDPHKVQVPTKWFNDNCSHYIVSFEKEDEGLHLQCGIQTSKPQHVHNLKTTFKRALNKLGIKLTPDENKVAIKIKPHADWMYLVGYCLKEQTRPILHPPSYFNEELIREAKTRYESGEAMYAGFKRQSNKLTIDQIADLIVTSYHHTYPLESSIHQEHINSYLRVISDHYSFSTYQKIKHESLLEYVNNRLSNLVASELNYTSKVELFTEDKTIKNKILSKGTDAQDSVQTESFDTSSCSSAYREEFESIYSDEEETSC